MSSAVQSSPVIKQAPASTTYAVKTVRTLAPFIDTLAAQHLSSIDTPTDRFSINRSLMAIQETFADAKFKIEKEVLAEIHNGSSGRNHSAAVFNEAPGKWISDTYKLVSDIGERVRRELYAENKDPAAILEEVRSKDIPELMRAFCKSSRETSLHLGIPGHRNILGVKTDFAAPPFNLYLLNLYL